MNTCGIGNELVRACTSRVQVHARTGACVRLLQQSAWRLPLLLRSGGPVQFRHRCVHAHTVREGSAEVEEVVPISVGREHILGLVRPTKPTTAVMELVANALDADATEVRVELGKNSMGGLDTVRVIDNGHGIERERFHEYFTQVGGSWKGRNGAQSSQGRQLFGSSGEGRFRAYSLGRLVKWTTTCDTVGGRVTYTVTGEYDSPEVFKVSDRTPSTAETGTVFEAVAAESQLSGLLVDAVPAYLAAKFARVLAYEPDLSITYDGTRITPQLVTVHTAVDQFLPEGSENKVELEFVEWDKSANIKRSIALRDESGKVLTEYDARIHAPGFHFTVFFRWKDINPAEAVLAEMGTFAPVFAEIRKRMRNHFSKRQEEIARGLVGEWKEEKVYPFDDESKDEVEDAKRELFNVVAVQAAGAISGDTRAKKLSLRLIREAIETAPGNLHSILREVLELPQTDVDDLAAVLEQTSLSSIISSSRIVADRLRFLRSLEVLLFDAELKKSVLERSQLHRILANESWIFGDQFHLGVDDKGLSEVLARHLKYLDRDDLNLAHIEVEDRKTAIVDLMLTKTIEDSSKQHHLVVELKRPSKTIGYTERQQIEAYAMAVAGDDRFKDAEAKWDFVLVANRVSEDIRKLSHKRNQPPGLIHDDPDMDLRIWIRHWGGIIEDRRRGLDFIKKHLEVDPSREDALNLLRSKYAKYLPDVLLDEESGTGDDGA